MWLPDEIWEEYRAYRHGREISRMMMGKEKADRASKPKNCRSCMYYHPDWKYRKCFYAVCPYYKNKTTLRHRVVEEGDAEGVKSIG